MASSVNPIFFGRAAADHAKIHWEHVESLKRTLEASNPNFFSSCRRIRPESAHVRTEEARQRIDALATKFSHYDIHSEVFVDARRIRTFLDQFPEYLAEAALKMLEGITFLDRTELGKEFAETLHPLGCLQLTSPGKSAEVREALASGLRKSPASPEDVGSQLMALARFWAASWRVSLQFEPKSSRISITLPADARGMEIVPSAGQKAVVFASGEIVEIWRTSEWIQNARNFSAKIVDATDIALVDLSERIK